MTALLLLERVGLHRPALRAWAMYDWANSAFMTTVVAAVFPIYFATVAGADLDPEVASFRFATTTFIALSVTAVLSPVLGAVADFGGSKKKMLGSFLALGVVATACMFFIQRGDWLLAAILFALANIGATASFVFYDSLLPHIASTEEMDRVSTAGYALGYLGGGLLLAVNLAWIQFPELFGMGGPEVATRLSYVSVAVWWVGFSIPLFRTVPEPALALEPDGQAGQNAIGAAFARLEVETFYRDASNSFVVRNFEILRPVAESAARGDERRAEVEAGKRHAQVGLHSGCGSRSHAMTLASKTGPSVQERTYSLV